MDNPTIEFLLKLLFDLAYLAPGAAALVVVLANIGKMFGWVKDGATQVTFNLLNVLFAVVIGVLALFFPTVNIPGLDKTFGDLAGYLTAFLPLLAILVKWLSPALYGAIRGVPVLGYHHPK